MTDERGNLMWNRIFTLLSSESFYDGCKMSYPLFAAMGMAPGMLFSEKVYAKSGVEPQQIRKSSDEIALAENQVTKNVSTRLPEWVIYRNASRR